MVESGRPQIRRSSTPNAFSCGLVEPLPTHGLSYCSSNPPGSRSEYPCWRREESVFPAGDGERGNHRGIGGGTTPSSRISFGRQVIGGGCGGTPSNWNITNLGIHGGAMRGGGTASGILAGSGGGVDSLEGVTVGGGTGPGEASCGCGGGFVGVTTGGLTRAGASSCGCGGGPRGVAVGSRARAGAGSWERAGGPEGGGGRARTICRAS